MLSVREGMTYYSGQKQTLWVRQGLYVELDVTSDVLTSLLDNIAFPHRKYLENLISELQLMTEKSLMGQGFVQEPYPRQ